eukprot:gene26824-33465_t
MQLTPTMQKYILHWGEMGTRWGVNRTVAQIHALLFLVNTPQTAEDIAETLNVARSNVSNSLKELQSWGLIRVSHVMGDRRDHFLALQDVWEIFRVIIEERKRREIDPTLSVLRGRDYLLTVAPSADYVAAQRGWQSWTVLTCGLLLTALLGGMMLLISGERALIQDQVKDATARLREREASRAGTAGYAVLTRRAEPA